MGGPNREAVGRDPANQAHACLGPPLTLGRIGMKRPMSRSAAPIMAAAEELRVGAAAGSVKSQGGQEQSPS